MTEEVSEVEVGRKGKKREKKSKVSPSSKNQARREKRTGRSVHRTTSDQTSFDKLVRITTKNLTILAVNQRKIGSVSFRERNRSVPESQTHQVPGSPSSALTTKYLGRGSFSHPGLFMKDHFNPEGKPAPPRPRSPEALICSINQESPFKMMSLVRCQSPRFYLEVKVRDCQFR